MNSVSMKMRNRLILTDMAASLDSNILGFFLGGSFAVVLINFVELINQ